MSTEGLLVRRTRSNPYKLPDDHFIAWLAEAKQLFQHELPPFVEKNQGSNRAGFRKNVTLRVTDDLQQGLPVEAEIICWSWSPYHTFCTIDIAGERLIVKGNSAESYPSYWSWHPKEGFSYQPVAFGPWQKNAEGSEGPDIDFRTQHAPSLGSSAKSDGGTEQASTNFQYTRQPEWRPASLPTRSSTMPSSVRSPLFSREYLVRQQYAQEQQHCIDIGHSAQAASQSTKDSPRPIQAKNCDVQASTSIAHYNNQRSIETPIESMPNSPTSGPRKDTRLPKMHEHSPKGPREPVQASPSQDLSHGYSEIEDQDLTSKPNEDTNIENRKQDSAAIQPTNERTIDGQPYGNNADAPAAPRPQYQGQHSSEPISLTRPTKRKRQTSIPNPSTSTSPHIPTATHSQSTPPQTPSTFSQNLSRSSTPTTSLPPHSTILLPPHKQSHTTLFIAIPLSTDSVPLKLRSCMSLSSFFTAVLAISAQPPDEHLVSGIRASFDWKREGDKDRAILLKRDVEDTFEVFLEIVDAAPCWRDKAGRCAVGVEVVLV